MGETFTAGIRLGGLTDQTEIRILLCRILSAVDGPMSFDELTETVISDGTMNYFELADAVSDLEKDGLIIKSKTESGISIFSVSEEGKIISRDLVSKVPLSVVEKAVKKAEDIVKMRIREKENLVSITETEDGYKIHMTVTDIGTDLMELSLFMPTLEQAQLVREKFLENPTAIYSEVLHSLAGEF